MIGIFTYFYHHRWLTFIVLTSIGILLFFYGLPSRHLGDAIWSSYPSWSPNGKYLLVGCAFGSDHAGELDEESCVTTSDLSIVKRFSYRELQMPISSPAWSPTMEVTFGDIEGLMIVDLNRSEKRVIPIPEGCNNPAWSPNGEHIACVSNDHQIIVLQMPNGRIVAQTHSGNNFDFHWTDRGVVFKHVTNRGTSTYDLILLDAVTGLEHPIIQSLSEFQQATISQDYSKIAYISSDNNDLLVHSLPMETPKDILSMYGGCLQVIGYLVWSPDNRYLAFAARRDLELLDQIYIWDSNSEKVFQVSQFLGSRTGILSLPMWSPDQAFIATAFDEHKNSDLAEVIILSVSPEEYIPVQCQ